MLFIAMRFVRGGDVRSLLDRDGPLSPGRATEIVSQVASALDAAHARGLVHRDVKPANMLLEASPDRDRPDHVYLADFGLTKASLGQAAAGLTSTGQFLGTLDYVAPEQIEGRPVDGRTDLYALGLRGLRAADRSAAVPRNEGMAVMYAQVSEAPPLLSSRRPGLPRVADEVFNRALAKRPERPLPELPGVRGGAAPGVRPGPGVGGASPAAPAAGHRDRRPGPPPGGPPRAERGRSTGRSRGAAGSGRDRGQQAAQRDWPSRFE